MGKNLLIGANNAVAGGDLATVEYDTRGVLAFGVGAWESGGSVPMPGKQHGENLCSAGPGTAGG